MENEKSDSVLRLRKQMRDQIKEDPVSCDSQIPFYDIAETKNENVCDVNGDLY